MGAENTMKIIARVLPIALAALHTVDGADVSNMLYPATSVSLSDIWSYVGYISFGTMGLMLLYLYIYIAAPNSYFKRHNIPQPTPYFFLGNYKEINDK